MTALTGQALEKARDEAQNAVRALRSQKPALDDVSIDLILRDARSHYAWQDRPVSTEVLHIIYEITANGPTSMNCCPARFVFVIEPEAKARLAKSLKPRSPRLNIPKTSLPPQVHEPSIG